MRKVSVNLHSTRTLPFFTFSFIIRLKRMNSIHFSTFSSETALTNVEMRVIFHPNSIMAVCSFSEVINILYQN